MTEHARDTENLDRSREFPTEVLMFSPEYAADPHSFLTPLREAGPIHRLTGTGGPSFLVVGHEESREALSDSRLSKRPSAALPGSLEAIQPENALLMDNMLLADPPDHTRLRRLMNKAFTPRRVEDLAPRIQQITDELIDAMAAKGKADLIAEFAFPLPIIVICELMGIPAEDRADFHKWSEDLMATPITEELRAAEAAASAAASAYLSRLIAERRADPRDDLVSALITARDEGELLNEKELLSALGLMLVAGYETTANLIGNGMVELLRNPDQLGLLRSRPELMSDAVEELLRYAGPVHRATIRIALEDMEIGGTPVPKHSGVHVSLIAANRDPEVFRDADRLDITRTDSDRNITLGHGIHSCLGAPLARLEARIAFATLLDRLPGIALDCPVEELEWRPPISVVRGLAALPVRF